MLDNNMISICKEEELNLSVGKEESYSEKDIQ